MGIIVDVSATYVRLISNANTSKLCFFLFPVRVRATRIVQCNAIIVVVII